MANWDKIRVIRKKEDMQVGQIRPMEHYTVLRQGYGGIDKDYTVTFRITEACDLKCNYCHWHSGTHYTFEDIVTSIDKLFEFFQKQKFKTVNFYYHGGEATRHPRVLDVLKYIKQKGEETGITAYNEMQTNLTIQEEKLRAMLPYCDQFNVSYHYLELLTRNKLDVFDRNWQVLKELNVRLHNFDVMLENVERDHKYYAGREIKIEADDFYSRVLQYLEYDNIENSEMIYGFCHYEYPDDIANKHMEFYKKYNKTEQQYIIDGKTYTTNDLFKQGIDARGWHCAAGTESITINGDGNVFHCGIHMTNFIRRCTPEIPYTNLVQDKLAVTKLAILYKTGTICKWDYCGGDFYLSRNKRDGV
jgi:MoaA/NifB/PqqE/SkfB family radical SAM enzyme